MCGIGGWIDTSQDLQDKKAIASTMLETLLHRGPDENAMYIKKHVHLLHARLSVMDPINGKQPMHYKQYVMVYNGEIYNTKQIKKDLEKVGYSFVSNCDSEVLIKAYDYYKEACLEHLNGIFAFLIWDNKKQSAFMARDRLGIKPFFYATTKTGFLFGSEIKTLLAHPEVQPIITKDGLHQLFLLGPAKVYGKTPFEMIYELKQGECATYKDGKLHKTLYWKPLAKKHHETVEESIVHVKKLIKKSIEMQLVSDVGICTFLSGGLDSSIISAIASSKINNLNTYSIEYEDNDKYFKKSVFQPNRDADFIDTMTHFINSKHHFIEVSQNDIVDALYTSTKARDLPGMAEVDASLLLFCKRIKNDFSVAVSGEGADEIFGGYPWYYNEEVLMKDTFPWASNTSLRTMLLKDGILEDANTYIKKVYEDTLKEVDYLANEDAKQKRMREMFYLNMRWFLQTLLDRKDRMSMYYGLEVRVPFLDYRIVEYAYNLPWEFKNLNGREKGIVREAFKDMLPKIIVERKKSPYPKTHHPLYCEMLITKIRTILNSDCLLAKLLDTNKVEHFIKNIHTVSTPWYGQLMDGPQILAYFIQMHYFFEMYDVKIKLCD